MKFYRTMKAARGALALDCGFDPFTSGGWGRCTNAKLAEHGYVVNPAQCVELERGHHCKTCQQPIKQEWTGFSYEYPNHCPQHRKWSYRCDNGHQWTATDAEDKAADHHCPTCGNSWQ